MFPSGGNVILQRNHHKHHLNTTTLAIVAIIAGVASVNNHTYYSNNRPTLQSSTNHLYIRKLFVTLNVHILTHSLFTEIKLFLANDNNMSLIHSSLHIAQVNCNSFEDVYPQPS